MTGRDDPFFDVPCTIVSTSEGEVELPARYFNCSNYVALFRVAPAKAEERLRGLPMHPVLVARRAVAVLSFFKYRETTLGPYHEVGFALVVTPASQPPQNLASFTELMREARRQSVGSCVLDLPVTTRQARAAGCEIWGYPKFVTELPIELDDQAFHGRVLDPDGGLIMDLSGERGMVLPDDLSGLSLLTYSILDGKMLCTRVETRGHFQTSGGGSLRLTIGDSSHRMAKNLQQLGLDGATPKLLQTTEDFQSLLFQGEPVS